MHRIELVWQHKSTQYKWRFTLSPNYFPSKPSSLLLSTGWKTVEDDPILILSPIWDTSMNSLVHASNWPSPSCCGPLGNKPADRSYPPPVSESPSSSRPVRCGHLGTKSQMGVHTFSLSLTNLKKKTFSFNICPQKNKKLKMTYMELILIIKRKKLQKQEL